MATATVAIARVSKYAAGESGDTAEVIECPAGDLVAVIVDGQGSGPAARALSLLVSGKALTLLRDGASDVVAAQATHEFLHAHRRGQVSATIDIASVDPALATISICRYNPTPYLAGSLRDFREFSPESEPIGRYRKSRPVFEQHSTQPGMRLIAYTDGVQSAGGQSAGFDPRSTVNQLGEDDMAAERIASLLLEAAIAADDRRPRDDMTVLVIAIDDDMAQPPIRRSMSSLPGNRA